MTRMFGFFYCAEARGEATIPRTTTDAATKQTNLPMHFMKFLLILLLFEREKIAADLFG
jgi:hypothetical protein